jgi:Probable Zinc-ribbon domain
VPSKKEKLPLSVTHPELAMEADGWDPSTITQGSSRRLSWICARGHRWETSPKHRKNGTGCPVCAGQQIVVGINDLKTTNPEIADDADGWDPLLNLLPYSRKFNWRCKVGHTWQASITSRKRGSGCPSCAGVRVTEGENDLESNFPLLANEVVGVDPKTLSKSSKRKVSWKCKSGHIYTAAVSNRTRGQGCGVCSGNQIQKGVNDLAATDPTIAREADGWDPTSVTRGSNKSLNWKCALGHTWRATPNSRCNANSNCPTCGGRKLLVGFNDLQTKYPQIAMEAFGWEPSEVLSGSNLRKAWRCALGHIWETQINVRISQLTGCPVCSGHKLQPGFNDLGTTHPDLAKQALGWDPSTISAGSHKKMDWVCDSGHHWNADVHSRASGVGCPICTNKKLLVGYNDLGTTYPEIAKEADGWDPTSVIAGSNKKQKWICPEGHRWITSSNKRTSGGRGCPSCAKTSFDPNLNGWLYLIENEEWGMLKVGITNVPKNRIALHLTRNWKLLDLRGPMEGYLIKKWETAILRMLNAEGADLSNDKIAGKFDGYSEAWSKSTFEVSSIKDLMRLTEEFET